MEKLLFWIYYDGEKDAHIIEKYDTKKGFRVICSDIVLIYNGAISTHTDQFFSTLGKAVKNNYTTHPIFYNGVDINPIQPDIFIRWTPGAGFYQDYIEDENKINYIKKLDKIGG